MNNQEAITLLRNLEDSLDSYCELNEEGKTAFRMAIEALNCSDIPNNLDTISRQVAIDMLDEQIEICNDLLHKGVPEKDAYAIKVERASLMAYREKLECLPFVQPERKTDGDIISRQEAIEAIIAEGRTVDSRYLESERIIHESDAVEAISMLPSAQQWTPVSEGVPVLEGWYNVTIYVDDSHKVSTLYRKDGEWYDYDYGWFEEFNRPVIAWMPLPDPYQGGDDE